MSFSLVSWVKKFIENKKLLSFFKIENAKILGSHIGSNFQKSALSFSRHQNDSKLVHNLKPCLMSDFKMTGIIVIVFLKWCQKCLHKYLNSFSHIYILCIDGYFTAPFCSKLDHFALLPNLQREFAMAKNDVNWSFWRHGMNFWQYKKFFFSFWTNQSEKI